MSPIKEKNIKWMIANKERTEVVFGTFKNMKIDFVNQPHVANSILYYSDEAGATRGARILSENNNRELFAVPVMVRINEIPKQLLTQIESEMRCNDSKSFLN